MGLKIHSKLINALIYEIQYGQKWSRLFLRSTFQDDKQRAALFKARLS